MKKTILLAILAVASFAFINKVPAEPGTVSAILQSLVRSAIGSDSGVAEELPFKRAKLAAFEKAIDDVTAQHEQMVANAPVCPINGQKAITTMTQDPRPDLRRQCDLLREEIRTLEARLVVK